MSIPIDAAHFPDENFRAIVPKKEVNGQWVLYEPQKRLNIYARYNEFNDEEDNANLDRKQRIRSLQGIEYLENLEILDIEALQLLENLGGINQLTKLKILRIRLGSSLVDVDLSGCRALEELWISGANLASLTLGDKPVLEQLRVEGNFVESLVEKPYAPLSQLDYETCSSLKELYLKGLSIDHVDPSIFPVLERLTVAYTNVRNLDLSFSSKLRYLAAYSNEARVIDISDCPVILQAINSIGSSPGTDEPHHDVGYMGKLSGIGEDPSFPNGHYIGKMCRASDPNSDNANDLWGLIYGPYPETTLIKNQNPIINHPHDNLVIRGDTVQFRAVVESLGTVSAQWYRRKAKKSSDLVYDYWRPISNGTSVTPVSGFSNRYNLDLSFLATKQLNGTEYYCEITVTRNTASKTVKTRAATLAVVYEPELIKSPEPVTIENPYYGQLAKFTVEAAGNDLNFQWQYSTDNNTWNDIQDQDAITTMADGFEKYSNTLSVVAEKEVNGYYYRCKIFNDDYSAIERVDPESLPWPTVISESALLTVIIREPITIPVITSQPISKTVEPGTEVAFSVVATGQNLSYQWGVRYPSGRYEGVDGADQSSYSVVATEELDGTKYQCFVSNQAGQVASEYATLHVVYAPIIRTHPQSKTVLEGTSASFSVEAAGHDLIYQWQFSSDNGATWNDIRNTNSSSFNVIATLSLNGYKYHCVITNDLGTTTSDAATLTVTPDTSVSKPVIASQPTSTTVAEGSNATFAVAASGNDLHYQWQIFKNNQWQSITGETNSSYVLSATRMLDGNRYRCVVSNAAGVVYSNEVTLTVSSGVYVSTPQVLTHPKSVNVDLGEVVTFWVRASGGSLTYQWQKFNNNSWYDITGAVGNTYTLTARTEIHNTRYRCIVTNTAGSVYSNSAILSIRAGQDLSFYGYHSIIISGKNTYGEWEMYPTSRPHVAPPEVKTSYVDLPGADGGLDYTDLLTGEPRYGYRKGSWEFLLIPQDKWASTYRSLVSFLHGRQHTVILEDDPDYVYTGRLSVNEWQSAAHNSLITIDYILEPHARNISGEEEDAREAEILDAANELLSKVANTGMVIAKVAGGAALIDPSMLFEDGDNITY